jgi:hypothetical protein
MLRTTRTIMVMSALAVGVASTACGGGTQIDNGNPQQPPVTTSPTTGLTVTAAISSASLGGSSANVQLAFLAGAATTAAAVEVVSVTLVDSTTGSVVDTLEASSPQVWNGSGYAPWNQRVTPGGDLKASYQLTAPDWSTMNQGGNDMRTAYSRNFKLQVILRIDGVEVRMQSNDLQREPEFAT